ncbi:MULTISPECIES: YkgJ family cysteine cluster protein [unclassified Campylobacter]|uniref:YkgJ family cysteine cluster protein n=1 Tax=unclassified Campylobacter TaxID=2593542 RepID=UPI001B8C4CB0|nr:MULTISPECIES: YkgJ family cysteine cluster protein [unclassified Campylobacter]QKG29423.1 putative Fe-S cluster-containing protein [Campylobacter sp. RM16187]
MIRQDGFDYEFDFTKCSECGGKCCTGESGYIWISPNEISALAGYLSLDEGEFRNKFLEKHGYKFSIKEKIYNGGYACIFFNESEKNCSIYEFRPKQCMSFPFWDYFKNHFDELERECVGIRRL